MKTRILKPLLLAALFVGCVGAARAEYPEEARQALRLVGADIQKGLNKAGLPNDLPIAILPVKGDTGDYALGILKTAITGAGLQCGEGKEDEFVDQIWKEVEWDERKDAQTARGLGYFYEERDVS